jgi:hypothetical protein
MINPSALDLIQDFCQGLIEVNNKKIVKYKNITEKLLQ